ncbi:MAG TPA: hypothetical protein DEW35_00595 [Ruminococcaceae bacterium]|nr:hypothetical protein [Oscillospiraceae bacterium]
MKELLLGNKKTVILYAVIVLLIATLTASCFKISAEKSRKNALTSQNSELKKSNEKKEKELKEKEKQLEEKAKQIEEKDKQIADLEKKNLELTAARQKAAANPPQPAPTAPAPSFTPPSYSQDALNALIADMTLPKPVEIPNKGKVCYLTFDDGPSTRVTPVILDILKKHSVKATFFVVGTGNLSLLKRMSDEGHTIGLHSNTHQCYKISAENIYCSPYTYLLDLKAVSDKVAAAIGKRPGVIRFPGGGSNKVSERVCKGIMTTLTKLLPDMGYTYFDWNVSSGDAERDGVPKDQIINNVLNSGPVARGEGICVLMHDTNAKVTTAEALEGIITGLKARGYTFEALSPGNFGFHHNVNN